MTIYQIFLINSFNPRKTIRIELIDSDIISARDKAISLNNDYEVSMIWSKWPISKTN